MYDKIKEIAVGLRQRQSEASAMAKGEEGISYGRYRGKASAYGHAAEMLEEVLKDSSGGPLAFLDELEAVYHRHGLALSHEDGHGAFEIVNVADFDFDWLRAAHTDTIKTH
jgi:hypothetical protein